MGRKATAGITWAGCVLTCSFLVLSPTTIAEEGRSFYVRQTVGDDANDGLSPAKAWKSLSMLADALQAGDAAYVGPGLYRETVDLANSGTVEDRITIVADPTGEHTGDPPGVVMVSGADAVDETVFAAHSTPGVYHAPFPERGARVLGVVEMDGLQYRYTDARDTREYLKDGMSKMDVVAKLAETFFYDDEADVLYLHTSDGKPPSSHELELIRRRDGIVTYGKHFVTIIGFTFRHMRVAGIDFEKGSSHCIALDNTSYGSWQGIRVSNATDVVVSGNTLFRNGNSGVYFLSEATGGVAIGNVAYDNAKGLRWSSGSANGLASGNVAFDNHEVGIAVEATDDLRIVGNSLVNNAVAQLLVRKSRFASQGNCFANGADGQLTAKLAFFELHKTLAEYRQASGQDLSSREGCDPVPRKIDVGELHADTLAYTERARSQLARVDEAAQSGGCP